MKLVFWEALVQTFWFSFDSLLWNISSPNMKAIKNVFVWKKKSTLNATRWQHGQNFNDTLSKKVALEVLLVYWFSWSACMECPMWPADAHSMNQNRVRRHIKGYKIKSYEWKQFFLVRGGRRIHNHGFVNGFRRKSHSIRSFSPRLWRNFIVYYIVCVYPDDVYVSSNEIKKKARSQKKKN